MAGELLGGISPYGMLPFYNNYANSVALNDVFGDSLMSTPNMFSMNGSLFNNSFGTPYMPYGGFNMNYEQYYNNMEKYQDFMYESQLRRSQRSRQVDFLANSPMESIQHQANILREKIKQNEQQQIIPALNKFIQSINAANGSTANATPEQLIARADSFYKQMFNISITDDIRENGNDSFTQGLLQSLTLGCADRTTAEENISRINGAPVSRWESAKKITGNTLGGAAIGAGSMFALASIPAMAKVLQTKPGFLGAIGAVVGALAGITMSAFNNTPAVGVPHKPVETNNNNDNKQIVLKKLS